MLIGLWSSVSKMKTIKINMQHGDRSTKCIFMYFILEGGAVRASRKQLYLSFFPPVEFSICVSKKMMVVNFTPSTTLKEMRKCFGLLGRTSEQLDRVLHVRLTLQLHLS